MSSFRFARCVVHCFLYIPLDNYLIMRSATLEKRNFRSVQVLLCRSCPRLETLVVRERISTATVLLLAHHGRSLRQFVVRGNAVVKKCDWPRNPDWSDEFYSWLRHTSQSYDAVCCEVSQILGFSWAPLTDKEFKAVVLRDPHGDPDLIWDAQSGRECPLPEHRLSFSWSTVPSPT